MFPTGLLLFLQLFYASYWFVVVVVIILCFLLVCCCFCNYFMLPTGLLLFVFCCYFFGKGKYNKLQCSCFNVCNICIRESVHYKEEVVARSLLDGITC